ncbi:acyltransferase [Pseudalkalibacillus hwajinpoensis]|uniref:acyltransferase n=1 Tax=Guptibacillus hwajinpoensis TaxID=208199 RepID=UPI001F551D74|nr:acyltransferase [Pseudalkalibacillus hwajinpoensis]
MAKKVVFSNQSIIQSRERGIANRAKIMHFISRIVKVNLLKTFLMMFRFSGNHISSFIIGWNTIVRLKKTAVISVCPEGRLTIGMNEVNGKKTIILLDHYANFHISGKVSVFNGCKVSVGENATLSIGDNTYINESSRITAVERITIGDSCAISWDVTIIDSDMHSIIEDSKPKIHTAPISIGNKVWIGANVLILKGVTIGDNVVIAAGTLVNRDIPDNSLVMGNPMKIVKSSIQWEL